MSNLIKLSMAVVIAASSTAFYSQSRPLRPAVETKTNQRPPAASPTPVPSPDNPAIDAQKADDGDVIKVATQLVSIPVRVMDKRGSFVGGLTKEDFRVFEDGVEQEIALFSNEHQPFTVALVLDMSYSSTFKLAEIQSAAIAFIDQLRPQDKVLVISFDEDVRVLAGPTRDRQEIYGAIRSTKIATGTSLYEAADLVMNKLLRPAEGRKAIILFTDGVDTTSKRSNDLQNLSDAMELDSLIYPLRYDTFADVQQMKNGTVIGRPPPITVPVLNPSSNPFPFPVPIAATPSSRGTTAEEYERALEYLQQLAVRTGGRMYEAQTTANLAEAYSKIASELREFYSISYYPKDDRLPGNTSKVKVKVAREGLVVRTRDGFVHPKKANGP